MLSTTSLLVEHFISGVMACIWIVLLLLCIYPISYELFESVSSHKYLILVVLSVLSYPVGMMIDNAADNLLGPIRNSYKQKEDYMSVTQVIYLLKSDNVEQWFTYNRFKIRIMRSCFLNSILTFTIMIACTFICRTNYSLPIAIVALLLAISSFLTWKKEVKATYKNIDKCRSFL